MRAKRSDILGVVLAGGRSSRMGGDDKAFAPIAGRPMLAHVAARLGRQVDAVVVGIRTEARAAIVPPGLQSVIDEPPGHGPLSGILAGIRWCRAFRPGIGWIATVPVDTPFFPDDLVARLHAASGDARAVRIAESRGRRHFTVGLWPVALAESLAGWLAESRSRAVRDWVAANRQIVVDFGDGGETDPFFNVNTPDDLERARSLLAGTPN